MITSFGFHSSCYDSALFVRYTNADRILLSLYVDDMIIAGHDVDRIIVLKIELACCFAMKDLGSICYFMGIEVISSSKSYLLSQVKYIADIFERARLIDNKIVDAPLETNARYSPSNGSHLPDPSLYQIIFAAWFISLSLDQILHMRFI